MNNVITIVLEVSSKLYSSDTIQSELAVIQKQTAKL